MSEKNTYTFSLEFALRVCDVCRSKVRGKSYFQSTSKYEFYELYRNEIESLRDDIEEIKDKIDVCDDRLDTIERAMDYDDEVSIVVRDDDEYFDYPDWMRVLFSDEGDKYVARLNNQMSDMESEKERLESNLESKRYDLRNRIRCIIKISLVDEDDWDELLKKVDEDDFEFSSRGSIFTSP